METEPYGLDLVKQRQRDAREMQRWTMKKKGKTQQPRRWKFQAMEIGSDVWFLATAPVEERSNDSKTQQPRRWFWPNLVADSRRRVVSRCHSSGGEEHVGEWVWFVLDLICSWVFGFVEEKNMLDGIWRKKERKNKKKIRVSLSDVLSVGWTEIKFRGLDFHKGKASPLGLISRPTWTIYPAQLLVQWEIECNILDLYTKIKSFELDLLDTKIISNLG